jgi:transcriptional regulator with XRE-family HTH domain
MSRSATAIDKLIGQNIRIFRIAKRLSQTELGAAIGVTFQQVQKYEKGANRVGSGRLSEIADFLDVPIIRLFDGRTKRGPEAVPGPIVTDLLSGPYAVKMLQAFSKIPSQNLRRSLLHLTESVGSRSKSLTLSAKARGKHGPPVTNGSKGSRRTVNRSKGNPAALSTD